MDLSDPVFSKGLNGSGVHKSDSDNNLRDFMRPSSTSPQRNVLLFPKQYSEEARSPRMQEESEIDCSYPAASSQIEDISQPTIPTSMPSINDIINAGLEAHNAQSSTLFRDKVSTEINTSFNAWVAGNKPQQTNDFSMNGVFFTSAGHHTAQEISNGLEQRQLRMNHEFQSRIIIQNPEAVGSSSQSRIQERRRASVYLEQASEGSAQLAKIVYYTQQSEVKLSMSLFETYHGFIEDPVDAVYVVQGTLKGVLPAFRGNSDDMASVKVRSGTVIVMPEKGLSIRRWRDGIKWSPSRAYGNFLLYRQIETKNTNEPDDDDDTDPRPYSAPYGSTTGLQPTFTSKTLKEGTRIAKNGLTKRTITVKGSDGEKHRVISYYNSRDVMAMMRAAQRGEGGGAGLLRASEDENLRDAVKLSRVDAIELVKQMYPAFEVIARQEIVKESPSKKVKLEGGVKLEDTIAHSRERVLSGWSHHYEREFAGYHPYRAGSLPYDKFKETPSSQYQQFGKQQQDRVEYAEARYKSQNRSHQQEHNRYVGTHHQSQSHHIQQQHFFQGYYQQPHHVQPQLLIYASGPEVSRQHQQGFHPAPYPNYEWSYSGQYNHNKYQ